jgi:adenosylhomocysteine nucleosidase
MPQAGRSLIVMALAEESQGLIEKTGFEVHYTGVGKVNAAYGLMRRLAEAQRTGTPVTRVVNLGSAGSPRFKTGKVVGASRFVQRDMDATGLGFRHGETPFDAHPLVIEFQPLFSTLPHGTCGSGDSFLQGPPPVECDIIDMEAYALAKICRMEAIPFACMKYITDGADGSAHLDWQENVRLAAHAFIPLLKTLENTA